MSGGFFMTNDIVSIKELTPAQLALVKTAIDLENEYGKGNVFMRYIDCLRRICFIVHYYNEKTYKVVDKYKINRKVVNGLEAKGVTSCCDSQHKHDVEPNSYKYRTDDVCYVGMRICTECVSWWEIDNTCG